jgi:hypothetical protein
VRGRIALFAFITGAVVLLAHSSGDATSLRPIPFREVARRADGIVVATVAGSAVRLGVTPAGRERPYTHHDLRDLSTVAGSVDTRNLVLPVIGGALDDHRLRVPGAPALEIGRRYVLFLKPDERLCGLVGWTQGVFRVERDAAGAQRVYTHDGAPVVSVLDGRVVIGEDAMSLGAFLDSARSLRGEGTLPPVTAHPDDEPRELETAPETPGGPR